MPEEKQNTLDDSFTLNIDLARTIIGAAGLRPDSGMQGRDMSELYIEQEGKKPWRSEFFYEYKLDNGNAIPMSTALVRKDYKYIHWPQFKYEQLFHLATDPLEQKDIVNVTEYASLLEEMRVRHTELEDRAN
jgi:arylsulfatase A-like enzyme